MRLVFISLVLSVHERFCANLYAAGTHLAPYCRLQILVAGWYIKHVSEYKLQTHQAREAARDLVLVRAPRFSDAKMRSSVWPTDPTYEVKARPTTCKICPNLGKC